MTTLHFVASDATDAQAALTALRERHEDAGEKAADVIVKVYPAVDRGVALEQIQDINDLIVDPKVKDRGLAYLRDDRIRSTVSFVDKAYGLNGKIRAEDVYTDDLLK